MSLFATRLRDLRSDPLAMLVSLIAVTTIAAGLIQLLFPGFMLEILDVEDTAASEHFFAIVGMFMAVVGGAVLHAMLDADDHPIVVFWGGVQKLGAVGGVALGVANDIFSGLALLVVAFDAVSAAVMFVYWNRIR